MAHQGSACPTTGKSGNKFPKIVERLFCQLVLFAPHPAAGRIPSRSCPVTVKERISVGATVPNDVELVAVPSDWSPSLTRYRYVYSNDRVMLVDPGSRTVVQEIDCASRLAGG